MDAFTHFFVSLALWNILLATLAFLFGLLMGHWMWGQFKGQLAKAKTSLAESDREVGLLADDAARLREINRDFEEGVNKEKETLSTELKASRVALEEVRKRASKAEKEATQMKSEAQEAKASLTDLEKKGEELTQERDEARTKLRKAEKEHSEISSEIDDWSKKERQLKSQISKEKSESASLREVISGLNDREGDLKEKLQKIEKELADQKNIKDKDEPKEK